MILSFNLLYTKYDTTTYTKYILIVSVKSFNRANYWIIESLNLEFVSAITTNCSFCAECCVESRVSVQKSLFRVAKQRNVSIENFLRTFHASAIFGMI